MFEIERKFLVRDDSYKREAFASSHIRQGYLSSAPGRTVRIRIRDDRAYLTIKGPSDDAGLSRYEFEQEVPRKDADDLMHICLPGAIEKTRWLVRAADGHIFEVDEFHGANEGLVVAEVELRSDGESFAMPDFIGREVTGDRRYYNSHLCRFPYALWRGTTAEAREEA